MEIITGISVILAILCVSLLIRQSIMKKQLRIVKEELKATMDASYNRQIRVALVDRELNEVVTQMNKNLEYQKKLKLRAERTKMELRHSNSDIAHDLRTPIAVVKGNLQMMEQDETLKENTKGYLEIAMQKTDVITHMVNDFFEMTLLESDDSVATLVPVELNSFLMNFIIDHEAMIREAHIEPEICLPECAVTIEADAQMLTRMLANLLNNSLRYSRGSFQLAVKKEESVYIILSNPIEENAVLDVEHLFDRTYRGDQARSMPGSAGLGLYIVKLLAQKQGMEITARRENHRLYFEIFISRLVA